MRGIRMWRGQKFGHKQMNNNRHIVQDVAGMYGTKEAMFKQMLDLFMLDYYFCLPCVVEAVNIEKQTVDIRPTLQYYSFGEETSTSRALIANVPFWMYRAGDTYITLPIKVGDTGLAIFSQRDITNWKETGGEVPLQSPRIHDYNDALFLPYFGPSSKAVPNYNPNNITIVKNGKTIEVQDGTLNAPDFAIECKSLHATGIIESDTDCLSGGISGKTHVHGGVTTGSGSTGVPS